MLRKVPTGISGFDEITMGGLPAGRPSLFCGAAGSGKTLFATTFLINGATRFDEPGVMMTFEERPEDLVANSGSLGFDLNALVSADRLAIDYVRVSRNEIAECGDYDLEGLFIRLAAAVDSVGAKRLVLDTIETLFGGFTDAGLLRAELRRLFGWIKDRGLTAIITAERGDGQFTRQGFEEYVSDCVVLLDNRVQDEITTRRLRIVKYRGSAHGTNEYPFLVDETGISVLPITSSGIRSVSNEIISTGIPSLDGMLRKGGFFRGSSILLSGTSGTGKTTAAATFVDAACGRSERCMFFVFEESSEEVCRNARSVGLDLQRWVDAGSLRFRDARPSLYGLEMHIASIYRDIAQFNPAVVAIDPISALRGPPMDVHAALVRLVDMLKYRGITALFTSLRSGGSLLDGTDDGLSSLMDAWIRLADILENGERNRTLLIIKARGSSHSNQVREYRLTDSGIELIDIYVGPGGVLTGTARVMQEARETAELTLQNQEIARTRRSFERQRASLERQIAEMRANLEAKDEDARAMAMEQDIRDVRMGNNRHIVATRRETTG